MVIFFIVLLAALVSVHLFCRYFHFYKFALCLPSAKGLPLISLAFDLWNNKDELLENMMQLVNEEENKKTLKEHGTMAVWIGPIPIVFINDLRDIEQILISRDLVNKAFQYKFFESWLGKGLFTASGSHWTRHRKIILPAFHFKILEKFIPVFNSNIDTYLAKLDEKVNKGSFDIENYIGDLTLDIIAETAMAVKINAQTGGSDYFEIVKQMTETILLRFFQLFYYSDTIFNLSSLGRKHKKNIQSINNYITDIINSRKEKWSIAQKTKIDEINTNYGEKERVGLLDLLLETQRKLPEFTDLDIMDEVNTFMFGVRKVILLTRQPLCSAYLQIYIISASELDPEGPKNKLRIITKSLAPFDMGHDTVTSAINFTLYLLSRHPAIQDKVLKEVESVVGEQKFNLSNLQRLNYLERVIKESLRMLPVAPFIARTSKQDIKLKSGSVVPAGCTMLIFIYALHRNPDIYPDTERFDPDRFLPENCRERSPYAFLPFSAGYRNCIGQKFAYLEMKAIIAATVRRYRILPSEDIKPVVHIILRSANGINLILERRSQQQYKTEL